MFYTRYLSLQKLLFLPCKIYIINTCCISLPSSGYVSAVSQICSFCVLLQNLLVKLYCIMASTEILPTHYLCASGFTQSVLALGVKILPLLNHLSCVYFHDFMMSDTFQCSEQTLTNAFSPQVLLSLPVTFKICSQNLWQKFMLKKP